jgi:CheY-like chemotaxis protein
LRNNAVKYTEPGGAITVSAQRAQNMVEIRVRDSGVGMSPELLPRLFNLFTQADPMTRRSQGGLGIGLALVRKLVEMHGGTVAAHSAGLGCGSEFLVCLPVLRQATQRQRPAASVPQRAPPARRILVVDDNTDALESLALLLRGDGHEVYTASDGQEALIQAETRKPEVVLLDIGMPELDGVQVGRKIRAESWGRRMTLIALTGWGQEADRKRTESAGFDAHLVKPLDIGALMPYLQPRESAAALGE